jgi:hypothetical protein
MFLLTKGLLNLGEEGGENFADRSFLRVPILEDSLEAVGCGGGIIAYVTAI